MVTKILSFNVNGLRAAVSKGFMEWLKSENPDIVCIQETKLQQGQIDTGDFEKLGYFNFWHYAVKKGYSGVSLLTKQKPDEVFTGIGNNKFDSEGRLIRADFNDITLLATYFPSGTTGDIRQAIKMEWLDEILAFTTNLKKTRPKLIVCGDFNICHKPIDINHPEKHTTYSGFLPEEREWFDRFINSGFVDSFRVFNQQPAQYSWWSYRANSRSKNLGWRIDYHLVTENLKPALKNATILNQVNFSDHCPVSIEIDF
jgi:exodeoxyribonuclease III